MPASSICTVAALLSVRVELKVSPPAAGARKPPVKLVAPLTVPLPSKSPPLICNEDALRVPPESSVVPELWVKLELGRVRLLPEAILMSPWLMTGSDTEMPPVPVALRLP